MNTQIQTLSFDTLPVQFSSDAFLNATAIAKHFKKRTQHYLDSDRTKEYIDALSQHLVEKSKAAKTAFNVKQLVIVKSGAPETGGGTWLHPKLAIDFARWLNPKFAVWCDEQIESLLNPAPQSELPPANPYALTEQDEHDLFMPLATYVGKLAGWLAKSKGVSKSQIEQQLVEQFGSKHEPFFKQFKRFYSRAAEWLQEELDKLPVVDFGVSRADLLNIFKRQCAYKQDFENWNDYQLQSWLDEQFFRNHRERYLGYPTSLESASYAQLTVLVDKMKHILGADFKLLDLSQQQKAALPKLRGTDGSIGQALFNYGADTPDKSELMWALQDMATLRHVFDVLLVINWDNSQLNESQLKQVKETNTILNHLSTMLMEAAAETLKH